jgi:hypothetical protein
LLENRNLFAREGNPILTRDHICNVVAACLVLSACGHPVANPPTSSTTVTTSAASAALAPYVGTAYAGQVQQAILDGFGLSSLKAACPQPAWVCAIRTITSPQAEWIDVTLQPNWEQVMGEWTGPTAGIGCFKWDEQITKNITNFTQAAHITPPTRITVYKPDGTRC